MEVSDIIQILMLGVVIVQLWWAIFAFSKSQNLQLIEIKADHDRRKKEATIIHLNGIRGKYRPIADGLTKRFGPNYVLNVDDLADDTREDIKEILGLMEHLAAGVNTGVLDFELVHIMSGSFLEGMYRRCWPYIKDVRDNARSDTLYIEFEHLVWCIKDQKHTKRDRRADLMSLPETP